MLILWKLVRWVCRAPGVPRSVTIDAYPARVDRPARYEVALFADMGHPARTFVADTLHEALHDAWVKAEH